MAKISCKKRSASEIRLIEIGVQADDHRREILGKDQSPTTTEIGTREVGVSQIGKRHTCFSQRRLCEVGTFQVNCCEIHLVSGQGLKGLTPSPITRGTMCRVDQCPGLIMP